MNYPKRIIFLIIGIACILITSVAHASDYRRLTLHFNDTYLRASRHEPATIHLKKELRKKYPDLNINNLRLEKAHVVAKSRKGRGTAQLQIKKDYTRPITIPGVEYAFDNPRRQTFTKIVLPQPGYAERGQWKLHLRGNIILRKITLFVEKQRHLPQHQDYYSGNYGYADHHYEPPYPGNHHPPHNNHHSSTPVVIGARSWGTDREAERGCGQGSRNVRDGWDYPNSICNATSRATYRSGYQPVKLFIRPDLGAVKRNGHNGYVKKLKISTNLTSTGKNSADGPIAAVLGITIAGQTYTKNIHRRDKGDHWSNGVQASLNLSGKFSRRDIRNAKVWILPKNRSGDFKVEYLRLTARKFS